MTDIERLESKLDLIIHSLGLDGSLNSADIERNAEKIVITLRERQLTRERKKSIKKECQ
jgi:hypothetical protein